MTPGICVEPYERHVKWNVIVGPRDSDAGI